MLVVLLAIAVIPLDVLARQNVLVNAVQLLTVVPMAAVGFIVARRQPGNPIGWLLLGIPVGVLLSLAAGPYAWLVYRMGYRLPFGPAAVLAENASWVALTIALPPVLVLFPDGEPSPRPAAPGHLAHGPHATPGPFRKRYRSARNSAAASNITS